MTTSLPPVRGRAPLLLSSTQWAQKEALSHLSSIVEANFNSLSEAQKLNYPALYRRAQAAYKEVDDEIAQIKAEFKSTHIAILKRELKTLLGVDVDPEQARIYTRYRENTEEDLFEYMARIGGASPAEHDPKFTFSPSRGIRALDESRFVERLRSASLWEAACENFSYRTGSVLLKPYSYEQASHIDYATGLTGQPAGPFITIVRTLDLGAKLKHLLDAATGVNGSLTQRVVTAARAGLEFDLLEAYRNSFVSRVNGTDYEHLLSMLKGDSAPHIWPVSMGLKSLIPSAFPHEATGTRADADLLFGNDSSLGLVGAGEIALPLFLIKVPGVSGVFSYFPQRLGGAFLWHKDVDHGFKHFLQQLRQDHSKGQLGWFIRHLALKDLGFFNKLLSDQPRPQGMTWLAGVLHDTFRRTFPEPDLSSLQLYVEMHSSGSQPVAKRIGGRQTQRYRSNLSLLATSKSALDWQAFREALSDIGNEVLAMLTTPMPGGVLGLNRIMQGAIFGSLAYSLVQGVKEASKGEGNTFASALADSADLLLSARLMGVAARSHRHRMQQLWATLGQPRRVTSPAGEVELWRPDLSVYPHLMAETLENRVPDIQGIHDINGKLYAKVQEGGKTLALEVIYDAQAKNHVLKTDNARVFRPPVAFDPGQQVWRLALDDVHSLDDKQLLQRMLPLDTADSALPGIERMLTITGTTREQLESTWQGQLVPGPLADGVRRLQADRLIEQIVSDFPLRGEMPANADSAIFCLLTQLEHWPADTVLDVFNQHAELVESYGKDHRPGTLLRHVEIKRLDHGTYVARSDTTQGSAQVEQLFTLILEQLPGASRLGRENNPGMSRTGRIAHLRGQIAELAREEKTLLFKALTGLYGHKRSDSIARSDPGNKYLPLTCPAISRTTTPLLAKLHQLNDWMSIESLEPLLAAHPFSLDQVAQAMDHDIQPLAFARAADQLNTRLRVDAVLDGIYHTRAYHPDMDLWAREFAAGVLRDTINRRLVLTDVYEPASTSDPGLTGSDDSTIALRHIGNGIYEVTDFRRGERVIFSATPDSFYLAISRVLKHEERLRLGMDGANVSGLRQTLGDAMLARRQPDGTVNLWDATTFQYQRNVVLPHDQAPGELGLYNIDGKYHVSLYGSVYQVEFDTTINKWRMKHPGKVGVNEPVLEHNHDGAWRQASENPLQWEGLKLLRRLRARPESVSDETGHKIMAVSNTSEGVLRQVHMNNLTPPPLLMDAWKRFQIEADIQRFVKQMQAFHSLSEARSDIQLLLVQDLPGWPTDKVLQIVDQQGNTLQEYGLDLSSNLSRIRLAISETDNASLLLRSLLTRMSRADTLSLLSEYPPVIEVRMLALAKKIAAHVLKRQATVFNSLYGGQERSADPHVTLVQKHYPELPQSVIKHLLSHTTGPERVNYFDKDLIAPRFTEQVGWTAREVRLARAYEGLYIGATATPESEMLTLHMLQSLPGWPAGVRIEVRSDDFNGELLDSIGAAGAGNPRVLVRQGGQYRAYSPEGTALNAESVSDNNLLSSILHALTPHERVAIEVKDVGDSSVLAKKISDLAIRDRANVRRLLGLEPPAPPRKPPIDVDTSFVAYPMTISTGHSDHSLDLIREVQNLYPTWSYEKIVGYLDALGGTETSRRAQVAVRRAQFDTMQVELDAWAQIQLYPTGTAHMGMAMPGHRLRVCERIVRAWRGESEIARETNGHVIGPILDFYGMDVGDLPALTGDFGHIRVLRMDSMSLRNGSNEFLSGFTQLHTLSMSGNRLTVMPPAIAGMTQLRRLDLSDNRLVLTEQSAQQLAACSMLEILDLSNNPLRVTPDVSQMQGLLNLRLQSTRITQWPHGLWALNQVQWANLRNNFITSIPEVVFNASQTATANAATTISGNPITQESRDRIVAYWVRGGSDFGFGPSIAHATGQARVQSSVHSVAPWLSSSLTSTQREARTRQWVLLQGAGGAATDFFETLALFAASQFLMTPSAWEQLKNRVWTLVEQMLANTQLRDSLLSRVFREERSCGDGAMVLLENMEVEVLIHEALNNAGESQREAELFRLAKRLFRLRQVDRISDAEVSRRVAEGGNPDAAEVILFYRVKLAEDLDLPTQARSMLYESTAGVSAEQLAEAKATVLALDGNPAFMHSIMYEKFWRNFLESTYAERFAGIEADYQRDYQQLSEASDLSDVLELQRGAELTAARDQKLNLLIEELTRQAYQANQ